MIQFGILVLLCVPLAPAYSAKQGELERILKYEGNDRAYWNPYAVALRRETRDLATEVPEVFHVVPRIFLEALNLPVNVAETIAALIRRILSALGSSFQSSLSPDSDEAQVCAIKLLLPSMIPFGILRKTFCTMESFVRKLTFSLLEQLLTVSWQFLSTTGLPWLRRTLDRVQELPELPDVVRTMIKSFDTFYDIAQLLGFVSPAY